MIVSIIAGDVLSAAINGRPYSITADNPSFEEIRKALVNFNAGKSNADEQERIEEMFNAALAVQKFMCDGDVTINGGLVYFRGAEIHGSVVDRILDFKAKGLPFQPLIAFLKRLLANPSKRSVEELYRFIEANKMPITEDGFVLGYKGVTENYLDVHTHTIDNHVGVKPPRMERNQVDDNWRTACSSGYHIGSRQYALDWGYHVVIVKIDPADVVSVPDAINDKMRVCYYEVVSDHEGELPESIVIADKPYAARKTVMGILKRLFGFNTKQAKKILA